MNAWNINVSIKYKEMLNMHLSQLILLSIDTYSTNFIFKKKIESNTKQRIAASWDRTPIPKFKVEERNHCATELVEIVGDK